MITVSISELTKQLRERIRSEGPITFRDWMEAALYDPVNGYYCRVDRKKWGREGDYRTSPERSSLFGATLAGYFAKLYEEAGNPASLAIIEHGAGDGSFAGVVLETLERYFPAAFAVCRYVIAERGINSQSEAGKRLAGFSDRVSFEGVDESKIDFGIVFSNELLDAFPVHRVKMAAGRLREFYVNVAAGGEFEWTLGEPSTLRLYEYFETCGVALAEGQLAEINLEVEAWLRKAAATIRSGYVVTVDYGANSAELYPSSTDDPRYFGTLRSFQRHRMIDDVLSSPGEQDLTTTVNWSFVRTVGEQVGLKVVEYDRLDKFLLSAGLLEQLEIESRREEGDAAKLRLSNAALEMILPTRMGAAFQVMVQKKQTPNP